MSEILISWSKPRSRAVASALHDWLPTVIPAIAPWLSSKDISKGKPWFDELQAALKHAKACLICVTRENVDSPWLYYEAGSVASRPKVLVCPYLIGIEPSVLRGTPLDQFQCTLAEKADTLKLLHALNDRLQDTREKGVIDRNFEANWHVFDAKLNSALATHFGDTQMQVGDSKEFISSDPRDPAIRDLSRHTYVELGEFVFKVRRAAAEVGYLLAHEPSKSFATDIVAAGAKFRDAAERLQEFAGSRRAMLDENTLNSLVVLMHVCATWIDALNRSMTGQLAPTDRVPTLEASEREFGAALTEVERNVKRGLERGDERRE